LKTLLQTLICVHRPCGRGGVAWAEIGNKHNILGVFLENALYQGIKNLGKGKLLLICCGQAVHSLGVSGYKSPGTTQVQKACRYCREFGRLQPVSSLR
jgi:hypothetical protein